MKKSLFIILFFYIALQNAGGQWYTKIYPGNSLSELNKGQLDTLYNKIDEYRRKGRILNFAGLGYFLAGYIISVPGAVAYMAGAPGETFENLTGACIVLGLGCCSLGTYICVQSWVRKSQILKQYPNKNVNTFITPSFLYLSDQNVFVPGITFTFRF